MDSCALVSSGQSGPRHSMAPAAWQAVRRGLLQAPCAEVLHNLMPAPTPEARATLSHVLLTCPVSQAVWQWFASIWAAISQRQPRPLHADLLLADDRRGPWQMLEELAGLWQRLRLLVITQLWGVYCTARSRSDRQMTAAHIAARVLAAARDQMPRNWLVFRSASGSGQGCLATGLGSGSPA